MSQDSLQEEYNTNCNQHIYRSRPSQNEIVVARSPLDGLWYRGQVKTRATDDDLVILFVDVGFSSALTLKNVCRCLSNFAQLPKQVLQVYLNGVDRSDSGTTTGKLLLEKLVNGKTLTAQIISVWPNVSVNLFDTSGPKDVDIVKQLIAFKAVKPGSKSLMIQSTPTYLNFYPG